LAVSRPTIEAKPTVVFDDNGAGVPLRDFTGRETGRAAFVHFNPANRKSAGVDSGAEAKDVHATLRLLSSDGVTELVPETQARWVEAEEQLVRPGRAASAAEVVQRNLPANGRPYAIDTVMQLRTEAGVRVWTQAGQVAEPLITDPCVVEVSL